MGRSRRKLNKFRVKVSRKPKRKSQTRSDVPQDILEGNDTLKSKLGKSAEWNSQERITANYKANNLIADPNAHFGRNTANRREKDREKASDSQESDTDDDLRQYEGKERHDGQKAELRKLTAQQQKVIKALIDAHGADVQAMTLDRKRNKMLLSGAKLRKMMEAYQLLGDSGRCGFRAPKKHG